MIEQKMRSALPLLAGLLLSAGAWGQSVMLVQDNDFQSWVAAEYFGSSGSREVLFTEANQAAIRININEAEMGTPGEVEAGNEAKITFTLNGATFAASATSNHLQYQEVGTTGSLPDIAKQVDRGGARGDRSVTYSLEVVTALNTGDNGFLYFTLPALDVSPVVLNPTAVPLMQRRGVTVVATIETGRALANPFPSNIVGASGATLPSSGVRVVDADADGTIIELSPALNASLGVGGMATVAINNLKTISDDGMSVTMRGGDKTRGLKVGSLTIGVTDSDAAPYSGSNPLRVLRSESMTDTNGLDSSLGGTAVVTVQGPFQTGDRVLLGADQTMDGAKAFEMGDGAATVSVQLMNMAAMNVVYVPGGVDNLTPGVFRASLNLDFNDDLNASGPVPGAASSGSLNYRGISTQAYAHGISRANDVAITSFLRMTCASVTPPATGCSIFINCTSEDGATYFGNLSGDAAVPSGGTGVYSSGDIASALGGGWSEGGGRCDLMSNGNLEVQHMIRTSGNALHNNSFVVGRTQTGSIGQLRSGGTVPAGSTEISLGPAAQPVYLLSNGHFYGRLQEINMIRAQLYPTSLPPSARFNAPPSSSGGGFQPMTHESDCAELDGLGRVTQVACFHEGDAALDGAIQIMSGDIVYARTAVHDARAVFRPSTGATVGTHTTGMIIGQAATSSAPVL